MGAWAPHRLADFEGDERERVLHRGRVAAIHDRARPRAAAVVRVAEQAAPARAALPGQVRRPAVVPPPPRAAGRDPGGLPALRRRDSHGHGRGCPLGRPARPRRAVAAEPRGSPRAVRRDAGAAAASTSATAGRATRRARTAMPLPMPADAYEAAGAVMLRERYARDLDAYGYEVPEPAADPGWEDQCGGATAAAARNDAAARTDRAAAASPAPRRAMVTEPPGRGRPDQPRGARRLRRAPPGGRDPARLHCGPARARRGALAAVRAASAAARGRARRRHRQPLDRRYGATSRAASPPMQGATDRLEVQRYPFAVARCGAGAPRNAGRVGAQPRLLLQLVVLARADRLRAQVGRRHGARRLCGGRAAGSCVAARGASKR